MYLNLLYSNHEFNICMIADLHNMCIFIQEKLPDYFSAWNYLAKQMPELVVKKQLREAVDKVNSNHFFGCLLKYNHV